MIIQLNRIIKRSFLIFGRNIKMSIASGVVVGLSFIILTTFIGVIFFASEVLNYVESQSQIIVFLNPATYSMSDVSAFENSIQALNIKSTMTFTSQSSAYESFLKFLNKENPGLSQSVDETKLPPSITIKTDNIDNLTLIADKVYTIQGSTDYIDKVLYYRNIENLLKQFIDTVRLVAIIFASLLILISFLIISISISIAFDSQKEEIEIMRLVGSTSFFINSSYILSGGYSGIFGGVFANSLIFIAYYSFKYFYKSQYNNIMSYLSGIPLYNFSILNQVEIACVELFTGFLIATICSIVAIQFSKK